jgi:Flp pilus assembly protein TadG
MKSTGRRVAKKNESGAAAVEFALISVILFTIVFGIIEFGQFYSQYQVFQSAAREGARVAAVRTAGGTPATVTEVRSAITAAANPYSSQIPGAGGSLPTIATACPAVFSGTGPRPAATVQWQQAFDISLPLVPAIKFTQTIKGVFQCEG